MTVQLLAAVVQGSDLVIIVPSAVALAALTGVGVWWRRHRRSNG